MGAFYFERGSPAQVVLGICAGLSLLVNNGHLPVVSTMLIVEQPGSQRTPFVISPPSPLELPELPQSPTRKDFVNLILAIQRQENAQHIDQDFLIAVASAESGWNPKALSSANAGGLFQLIPATAKRFGVTDRFDPVQSVQGGIRYLKWLSERFGGDYRLIAAGYNAGENAVKKYGGIPPYNETRIYVSRVIGKMAGFKTLRDDWSMRPECKEFSCIHLKSKEAIAGGDTHDALHALAAWVQSNLAGFLYLSGLNDLHHQKKFCKKVKKNRHCIGLAFDFTVAFGTDINSALGKIKGFVNGFDGFKIKALDNCNGCTGFHFHVEINNSDNADVFLRHMVNQGLWTRKEVPT
ncbi:MAG: lytic transglycosylase domain-containing protein [Candidatus Parabeggiatoa sp.]|nr:lytic transglycosylase domain-containing protein [Candidatus Parabeggiatoa sp.]